MYEEIDVNSRMLSRIGFDNMTNTISVTFSKSGKSYEYPASPAMWAEFQAAPSKGQWFLANLKPLGGTEK